jgi:hypothetical protein
VKVRHSDSRRSADWNLSIERRGSTLVLEVSNPGLGKEWRRLIRREQWPEFDIDLEGPPLPTVVSWRQGDLTYADWAADLETSFLGGKVRIRGGSGNHRLQAINSSIDARDFHGSLSLKGGHGPVSLSGLRGALHLNWLQGVITARDVRGEVDLDAGDSEVRIDGGGGSWKISAGAGRIKVAGFQGRMRAIGRSTAWDLSGRAKSDIEVINGSGPVRVKWPAMNRVFLTSHHGRIRSPYQVEDRDGRRVAERRASKGKRARPPLGQVFVRTESGDISFTY